MKALSLYVLIHFCGFFSVIAQEKVFIQLEKDKSEKQAIVILPGLNDSKRSRKTQLAFFSQKGYDIYIPDYIARENVASCVKNLTDFYRQNLSDYEAVHFFSYILGSWVLNLYINEFHPNNIKSIIYDRSPLQERAPYVVSKKIPGIIKMLKGTVVKDLSTIPYPVLADGETKVGIIIESKATPLIKKFKKTALSMGEVSWDKASLNQQADDYFYTWLHHKQMYSRFDIIGAEIFSFIANQSFSHEAKRTQYEWDPFEKYKEKRVK